MILRLFASISLPMLQGTKLMFEIKVPNVTTNKNLTVEIFSYTRVKKIPGKIEMRVKSEFEENYKFFTIFMTSNTMNPNEIIDKPAWAQKAIDKVSVTLFRVLFKKNFVKHFNF
jgi:hypothetical protein